jgi:hypothetical protein
MANAEDPDGVYEVPWKLIPAGESDVVQAKIELIDKNFDPESVIFSTPQGQQCDYSYDEKTKTYTITLVAGQENDVQEIYALYKRNAQHYLTLGRLNVVTYKKQTPKVVVVNVNKNEIDATTLKTELDKIYVPVGVDWQVSSDTFTYDENATFLDEASSLLQTYTEPMLALQAAYKQAKGGIDKNTAYLFILNKSGAGKNRDAAGFMPRGKQFGYIFKKELSANEIPQVIAHELGHGQWKLRHTFDDSYGKTAVSTKGTTANLMDYNKGSHLAKWQWDMMTVPAVFDGVLDTDEEAMSDNIKNATVFLNWLKSKIGQKNVAYNKSDFYSSYSWFDVPIQDKNLKITFFVELGDNGTVNFNLAETENLGVSFDLNKSTHNGFYLRFYYANNLEKAAITLWCYSYEHFSKLYEYLGLTLLQQTKDKITADYKNVISEAQSDCNTLDVIYETIPDFVISQIPAETLYAGIEALVQCEMTHLPGKVLLGELSDTDEEKALLNLLKGIDKTWIYNKINASPNLIEDFIFNTMGVRYEKEFLEILNDIAEANWKQADYKNSNYYALGDIDWGSETRKTGCLQLGTLGEYTFGTQIKKSIGYSSTLYDNVGGCSDMFTTKALSAISVQIENNAESGMMPALVLKYLSKQMIDRRDNEWLTLSTGLMLPQVFGKAVVGVANAGRMFKNIDDFLAQIPTARLNEVKEAFNGTPILKYAEQDMILYRHCNNRSPQLSNWYTDKILSPAQAEQLLALPISNKAERIVKIKVPKGTPYIEGKVAGQRNNPIPNIFSSKTIGGGQQIYFLDEHKTLLQVIDDIPNPIK